MPEDRLEAEREEQKPHRRRRLTLMESYGAFSDDRLQEVTEKIRDLTTLPKPPQVVRPNEPRHSFGDPIGESIDDQIGDPIGTPIQTPIEQPIYSPIPSPRASPYGTSGDQPVDPPNPSPIHSPDESSDSSPNGLSERSSRELRALPPVLLTENQAILYFCLKKINGTVTSLNRIAGESGISEHTLKSCLKKLRQEALIIYGGRRNCGGRIGFTAKTINRRIILRGDKGRLSRKLQQIDYKALSFTDALEDTQDIPIEGHGLPHRMVHLMDNRLNHPIESPMDHPMDHPDLPSLRSSSKIIQEELLHGLICEDAFADLNPRSLAPFLGQFDSTEELQNFLDMANACIAASRDGQGKPIQNAKGFLFACLRAGYVNPPQGYKSRRVRAQELKNQQLKEELATLQQLKEQEKELRFEIFQATLTPDEQERLEHEARQRVNPDLGLSTTRQIEVYKEDIVKRWFDQRQGLSSQLDR